MIDPGVADEVKIALAALCGGALNCILRTDRCEDRTFWRGFWNILGCAIVGVYGGRAAMEWFSLSAKMGQLATLLLGMAGLAIASGILDAVQNMTKRGVWQRLLERLIK